MDQRTGSELTPRDENSGVAPVPSGDQLDVERFSAGPRAHTVGLTEERAAQVIKQSGGARNAAFIVILIIALFIPVYWFYDLGITALGMDGRMEKTTQTQYVTDVERGYDLYLNNCASCHGNDGEGGIGPPLNNQAKLYNSVTDDGKPGTGHFNPTYLHRIMEVGGRYVCGDANSLMPAWLEPAGPMNYRQVEEIIAFLLASKETEFEWPPHGAHTTGEVEHRTVTGWRDPDFEPAPGAPAPPACWRNPSGQIGGSAPAAGGTGGTVDMPGTVEAPRVITVLANAALQFTDADGAVITDIPVVAGEIVRFEVDNTAGYSHNLFIGTDEALAADDRANLVGIPDWNEGVQTFEWTVPEEGEGLKFGCTVPGHYALMQGTFTIQS